MFNPGSEYPLEDQLNSELEAAFTGDSLASYLAIIQELPPSNIFETTTLIAYQLPEPPTAMSGTSGRDASPSSPLSSSSTTMSSGGEVKDFFSNPSVQNAGIAVAAGAACLIIIVTGLLIHREKRTPNTRKERGGSGSGGCRTGQRSSIAGHTVEISSSNDSRSATPYSRSATPMALGHHQRSITMSQHQQLNQLGSQDSTLSQGEWDEFEQRRPHHTAGSGGVTRSKKDKDEADDGDDDDNDGPLTQHPLLHDVPLSST